MKEVCYPKARLELERRRDVGLKEKKWLMGKEKLGRLETSLVVREY